MDTFSGLNEFRAPSSGVVLTIGNFDGVHLGHRALLDRARSPADACHAPIVVLTFDPHPLRVLRPDCAPPQLSTLTERLALLEHFGADHVIVQPSSRAFLEKSPEQFIGELVECVRPRAIIEGRTFSFGRDRAGSVETLREHAVRYAYAVDVVDELHCDRVAENPPINSSAIRAALCEGRVEDATAMLGRPHRITGVVSRGDGRGAGLGFPTANLDAIAQLVPAHGVYAAHAQLGAGALRPAAVNIGLQPTFEQTRPRVEAHLLDFDGALRGRRIGLYLVARLRDQIAFSSVEALSVQLSRDVIATRSTCGAASTVEPRIPI